MAESKWCRCAEPKFIGKHVDAYMFDVYMYRKPEVAYENTLKSESINNFLSCHEECQKCNKPWRKWKNIRGTELIDYPIGTVFRIEGSIVKGFYLERDHAGCISLCSVSGKYAAPGEMAITLLQDRFEIVEDVE